MHSHSHARTVADETWRTAREALEARVAHAETAAQQALRDSSKVRARARCGCLYFVSKCERAESSPFDLILGESEPPPPPDILPRFFRVICRVDIVSAFFPPFSYSQLSIQSRPIASVHCPSSSAHRPPQDAAVARRLLAENQRLAAEVAASTDEALVDARAALERRERQLDAVRAQKAQLQVCVWSLFFCWLLGVCVLGESLVITGSVFICFSFCF
jgi:hypothetical protein